jgi:hypothetical protein
VHRTCPLSGSRLYRRRTADGVIGHARVEEVLERWAFIAEAESKSDGEV